MLAHDHWTIGPVADRVGIVLVGLSMISPAIWVLIELHREGRAEKRRRRAASGVASVEPGDADRHTDQTGDQP